MSSTCAAITELNNWNWNWNWPLSVLQMPLSSSAEKFLSNLTQNILMNHKKYSYASYCNTTVGWEGRFFFSPSLQWWNNHRCCSKYLCTHSSRLRRLSAKIKLGDVFQIRLVPLFPKKMHINWILQSLSCPFPVRLNHEKQLLPSHVLFPVGTCQARCHY